MDIPKPSITAVWEHYGGRIYHGAGIWLTATCLLHDDHHPSARLNEDECRWNCFVCDKTGDAVDLIMEIENVGIHEAIQRAKGFAGDDSGHVFASDNGGSGDLLKREGNPKQRGRFVPPWVRQ